MSAVVENFMRTLVHHPAGVASWKPVLVRLATILVSDTNKSQVLAIDGVVDALVSVGLLLENSEGRDFEHDRDAAGSSFSSNTVSLLVTTR